MFIIFEIAVTVLVIAGMVWFLGYKKKKNKSVIVALSMCAVIAALISANIVKVIPLPCDKVTITATGEKNEEASSNEVAIVGLCVSDEIIELQNPIEGKWFWKGNLYMWRNESDPRQPDGTTRTITIEIPIGKDRSVEFGSGKWSGYVDVTYDGNIKCYDLFKDAVNERGYISAYIPDTNYVYLYAIKLLRLGLFAVIIAALLAFPVFCALKYEFSILKNVFIKHWDKIIYLSIAVFYVLLLQHNSVESYLNGDEIYELGWKYTEYPYSTNYVYYYLSKLWLYIMPFGQEYLLLLSQLLVAGTIYFSGLIGNMINGKRMGILSAVLTATSLSIVYQCSLEFRIYPFTLIATTFMLYMFMRKQRSLRNEKVSELLVYGVSIAITMDMHVFATAVAGFLMAADLLLIILKKGSKKCWLEFVIPAIYGIWWFIFYFIGYYLKSPIKIKWGKVPDLSVIKDTLTWLQSSSTILFALLVLGASIILVGCVSKIYKKQFDFVSDYSRLIIFLVPVILISVVHLYSKYINPESPLFVDRYFIAISIFLIIITAIALDTILGFFENTIENTHVKKSGTIFVIVLLCIFNWSQVGPTEIYPAVDHTTVKKFKQTADYLLSQNDIYCDSTLYMADMNTDILTGYQYYLTNGGKRDAINAVNKTPRDLSQYNVIYSSYIFGKSSKIVTPENFEMEYNNEEYRIIKFIRKSYS